MAKTFWDSLAKTKDEMKLLSRLRRTAMGKLCENLYNDYSWQEEGDTFGSEVVYRVGYEIGHWYQDLEEYYPRYPDGITPAQIVSAKRWIQDAERILNLKERAYF